MGLLDIKINALAGLKYKCSCGHEHIVDIRNICVGKGIIEKLPLIIEDYKAKRLFLFGDINTFEAAGSFVEKLLEKDFLVDKYIFKEEYLIPDEKALGKLLVEISRDTSLIIAVGSGTVNDLARFISYKLGIPYVIICTAPSMDGYASTVSPLIVEGIKTTYSAVYPLAIFADINIMKNAPVNMLHAGLGDILGKYTALADWRISNILKDEYLCPRGGTACTRCN